MSKIIKLLEKGESETVEFKPSLSQTDKIMESVSAFSNNQRVSSDEIRKMALEGKKIYWDEEICEGASLEDIDEEKVRWYLERREEIRKVKKPEKMDIETLLLNIGAAKKVNSETKPTNAGILFFGKKPQRFVFQRIDKLEYPIKAIREAIINALIHRNYFEPADTRVAIFDDRIEIISPGSFPEGVTPEEPKHVPVNPILCQLMYDVGFIEKYGSGIYMINMYQKFDCAIIVQLCR